MELKVWVEGIQRIVCGVNEKTTCQDVVFALAHATGKTGRFTLIERWRNSERLLAPSEQPLKVLLNGGRGEHSNDVQFILQWSPLESATNASNRSGQVPLQKVQRVVESSCSDNSSSHSPSPLSKPNHQFTTTGSPSTLIGPIGGTLQPNGPKKTPNSGSSSSYTSNDSRLWSPFSQNGPNGSSATILPNTETFNDIRSPPPSASGSVRGGASTQRLPLDHVFYGNKSSEKSSISSPPPYREPPSPSSAHNNQTPPLASPQSVNMVGMKSLPPYREPPPPNLTGPPNFAVKSINSNNSKCNSPSTSSLGTNAVYNDGNSSGIMSANNVMNGGGVHGFSIPSQNDFVKYASPSSQQQDSLSSGVSSNDVESWKNKDHSLMNGDRSSNQNGSSNPKVSPQSYSSNTNSHYRSDLIQQLNNQREKLTSQQAELTQYDAEIMFWEGKSKEQQKHMDLINKEISRLEVVSAQHESQALSLAHLEEECEYTQRESVALKSEINNLRAELEKCDDEIDQCKQRISVLMEELHLTQHLMNQRQQEWLEKEAATLAEIEGLRKDLDVARRETDTAKDMSVSLDKEVQSIETSLGEKKKQMERLVNAMKEANLQSLSIQPPEDLIDLVHHRSGSTRRMIGSPRQLENAAPTSKNPHGVWV